MKTAIVFAMKKEAAGLITALEDLKEINLNGLIFHKGFIGKNEIIVVVSGIGKVATAIAVSLLVNYFKDIDRIVGVGLSGGNPRHVSAGDVVIGMHCGYADAGSVFVDNNRYGEIGDNPKYFEADKKMYDRIAEGDIPFKAGTILTGDRFFHGFGEIAELEDRYFSEHPVCAFDMETAALAQTASFYKIPFISVRVISDLIGSLRQAEDYRENAAEGIRNADRIIDILLNDREK